ncbi:BTAD domain-containing putative transcriptional regulator [Actinoplanes sp. NPDC051851]|uniref:AfsR/SARP family transcriptional regulator n=1 Tax=Actinoplanes sp. NPDC051851 TaxID=3154753 RepID=UPI003421AE94
MTAEIRLLGDIEVLGDGATVDAGHPKQTYVLAALAVDAGRCVPAGCLVERVWGTDPPRRARETTRAYLCRLRQALEPCGATILRQTAGYLLTVDPLAVDLHRFRGLAAAARAGGDPASYRKALGLFRGEPLGRLDSPWAAQVRAELARERQAAERDHIDLLLADGRHAETVGVLTARAAEDPLDERLAGQLILALYRSGRRADALEHYRRVRHRLAGELGIDPGPSLQRLHQRMLREGAPPAGPRPQVGAAPAASRPAVPGVVPRQLPPLPAAFRGRSAVLSRLGGVLSGRDGGGARVALVHGPGGVGKTWLALRWAHDNAHRFPDGQLYVNLRGFDPGRDPLAPEAAVRGVLAGLGVTAAGLPPDPDSQTGLYRSLVAGRRMLVVLDDARTPEQVVPLLPGSAGCATLITSRTGLAGLVTGHSARPVPLGTLDDVEAEQVLAGHLGPERPDAEPAAVAELVRHCAGLSLALGIVAGRALLAPELPLAALAAELREEPVGLGAVLATSLAAVRPGAAELFRRMGVAPGAEIGADALRHLTGWPRAELAPALRELVDGHLVQEYQPGRYRMHDLVRAHAAAIAGDPAPFRDRMLEYYTATARTADLSWFDREHQVLLACAAQAGDRLALTLVDRMITYLERRGRWHDRLALQQIAVRAAGRLGDARAEAEARRGLANARIWLRAYAEADDELAIARRLFGMAGDRAGLAATHRTTARMFARQHRHAEALVHDERALALLGGLGDPPGEAVVLNAIGWHHAHLGDAESAIDHARRALRIQERLGDDFGAALTRDTLGVAYRLRGDRAEAVRQFRAAIAAFAACGDRYQEADTLRRLGAVLLDGGDARDARAAWQRAATILSDLGHPDADEIHRQLSM